MSDYISKVAVVGCSFHGDDAALRIFEGFDLSPKSSVIIIPHINGHNIYNSLSRRIESIYPINDNQIIEPGQIYVAMKYPNQLDRHVSYADGPDKNIVVSQKNGNYFFNLEERSGGLIDSAFMSVAEAFQEKSIGIILNGTGNDGSRGIKNIIENGGITIAQKTKDKLGMPAHAIGTGSVEYILTPKQIRTKLEELLKQ